MISFCVTDNKSTGTWERGLCFNMLLMHFNLSVVGALPVKSNSSEKVNQ